MFISTAGGLRLLGTDSQWWSCYAHVLARMQAGRRESAMGDAGWAKGWRMLAWCSGSCCRMQTMGRSPFTCLDPCLRSRLRCVLCKQAAWKAMEQLVDEGLVLSIGLQDADIEDVTAVMEYARITPAVNSLEVHPGNRNDALLAFCRSQVCA